MARDQATALILVTSPSSPPNPSLFGTKMPSTPAITVVPLVLLVVLAVLGVADANTAVFLWLNQHTHEWASPAVWSAITQFGTGACMLTLAAAALIWAPRLLGGLMWSGVTGGVVVQGIKRLVLLGRPAAVLSNDDFHLVGEALVRHSFPSGHALTAFAAMGTLIFLYQHRSRWLWLLLLPASLIAISRIAVGAHWPMDVLMGAALGWLCAAAGVWLTLRWPSWHRRGRRLLLCVLVFGLACSLWRNDLGYPLAAWVTDVLAVYAAVVSLVAAALLLRERFTQPSLSPDAHS